jgi:hypothetical protein
MTRRSSSPSRSHAPDRGEGRSSGIAARPGWNARRGQARRLSPASSSGWLRTRRGGLAQRLPNRPGLLGKLRRSRAACCAARIIFISDRGVGRGMQRSAGNAGQREGLIPSPKRREDERRPVARPRSFWVSAKAPPGARSAGISDVAQGSGRPLAPGQVRLHIERVHLRHQLRKMKRSRDSIAPHSWHILAMAYERLVRVTARCDRAPRPQPWHPCRRTLLRRSLSASRLMAADFAFRWIGKRKPRMRPMKLRKKREKQSRKTIQSFTSRCMTT